MRDSFVMYTEYMDVLESLTAEQAGLLIRAMVRYARDEEPDLSDPVVSAVFLTVKPRMDRDRQKWEETVEKRREAGKQGGRPSKANASDKKQEKAKKANGFSKKQSKAKKAVSVTDSVTDSDSESVNKGELYQDIACAFHDTCKSLPRVRNLNQQRKAHIRNLLKTYTVGDIRAVFEKAEASDFLSGRSGKWNGCGFDWLIKPSNFIKVLEGNYDNKDDKDLLKQWAEGDDDGQETDGDIIDIPAFFVS